MAVKYLLAQSGGVTPLIGQQEVIGAHIPELSDTEEEEEETDLTVCQVTDVDEALPSAHSLQSITIVGKNLALPLKKRPLSQTQDGATSSPNTSSVRHVESSFQHENSQVTWCHILMSLSNQCVICYRDCFSEEDLEQHMQSHTVTLVLASAGN